MKGIIISFFVLCLIALLLVTRAPNSDRPPENSDVKSEVIPNKRPSPADTQTSIPTYLREEKPVADQMDFILTDAHVASDKYLLLVELLKTNEDEVLAYLAERRYPEKMEPESPEYNEVEMIARAMLAFYREKPLGENLKKVEVLRQTGPLFSDVVSDLFFAGTGAESAKVAYEWVMQNPEHPASLRSGATIGTILNDFAPEEAWGKAVELPNGPIRARAFSAIIESSAGKDIDAAIDYINSVEATPDLDGAISNVLNVAIHDDYPYPELVNLAAAPVDPVYRSASLTVLFENWAMKDPDSLRKWSNQEHKFPAEQMAEINLVLKQVLERH